MENKEESKTKKFITAAVALIKAMAGFMEVSDEKKTAERKKIMAENMGPVMEALDDLLISPTKNDLALISTESALMAKVIKYKVSAEERSKQPHVEKEIEDMNTIFQNYLLYKAENLEAQDPAENDKLIKLIKDNMSKAA